MTDQQIVKHSPQLVAITVPFPGCLFGALVIARQPERFDLKLLPEERTGFARNEIPFDGQFDYDLNAVGEALRAAT